MLCCIINPCDGNSLDLGNWDASGHAKATCFRACFMWANAELCVERIKYFILEGNQKLVFDSWMCLSITPVACYNNVKPTNFRPLTLKVESLTSWAEKIWPNSSKHHLSCMCASNELWALLPPENKPQEDTAETLWAWHWTVHHGILSLSLA